ncbi:MAG: hypothetical protein ABSG91_13615 [Syntrophobacteraceae bacterium]
MFHPHFLDLFFGSPHSMGDTMQLVSAFKIEQDIQEAWREERELEDAREKEDTSKPVDYNKKPDGPYK